MPPRAQPRASRSFSLSSLWPERSSSAAERVAPGPSNDLLGNWWSLVHDPTKRFACDKVRPVLGNGLLTNEGESWLRQRRLLQPAFQSQRLLPLAETMVQLTVALMDEWEKKHARGEAIDISAEMMTLTLRIVATTLFGVDIHGDTARIGEAMAVLLGEANRRVMSLTGIREKLPGARRNEFAEAKASLDDLVYRIITERERRPTRESSDLLTELLALRDENRRAMSRTQLRDELVTLLVAGHETTAGTLGWAFYLLARNPWAWRRLRAEVTSVVGDRAPTQEDLAGLGYTRMVLDETMRLYPPGWVLVREAEERTTLSGFEIPARSVVAVCPYLLHRDARYWESPEGFDPERFATETSASRPRFAYLPWSAGPRMCIGKAFATMEMSLIVAAITQRFQLDLVPTRPVDMIASLTLRARNGIWMRLRHATT